MRNILLIGKKESHNYLEQGETEKGKGKKKGRYRSWGRLDKFSRKTRDFEISITTVGFCFVIRRKREIDTVNLIRRVFFSFYLRYRS